MYVSAADRRMLAQLCAAHRVEYSLKKGSKGPFWARMRVLLCSRTGKQLKDPSTTMKALVADRRAALRRNQQHRAKDPDLALDKALDTWIEWEDHLQRQRQRGQAAVAAPAATAPPPPKSPAATATAAAAATTTTTTTTPTAGNGSSSSSRRDAARSHALRENLLLPHSRKRRYPSSDEATVDWDQAAGDDPDPADHDSGADDPDPGDHGSGAGAATAAAAADHSTRDRPAAPTTCLMDALEVMVKTTSAALEKLADGGDGAGGGAPATDEVKQRLERVESFQDETRVRLRRIENTNLQILQLLQARLGQPQQPPPPPPPHPSA